MSRRISILFLAALGPALASLAIHWGRLERAASPVVGISYAEAVRENVIWVDARPAEDYRRGHVPGAIPLGVDGWDQGLARVAELWEPGVRIVVYCSGGCDLAREAAVRLRTDTGIGGIYTLEGGWPPANGKGAR